MQSIDVMASAGLALLPLVFGLPILFGPIHIALLEMVIAPVCSLVFEAETEEEDVMRRPTSRCSRGPWSPGACCRDCSHLQSSQPFTSRR